jgi:hypothetical protein
VRKTQKVESESFALISFLSALVGVSTKLDKPCLTLVQREGEFLHAFFEIDSETLCIPLILESNDEVIRISYYDDLSPSMTLAPLLHP